MAAGFPQANPTYGWLLVVVVGWWWLVVVVGGGGGGCRQTTQRPPAGAMKNFRKLASHLIHELLNFARIPT